MPQMTENNILDGRFELTRRLSQCGETVLYLGRDTTCDRMVTVREFCPAPIMRREEDGRITVVPGCEVQYKSLSSDYEELCRYLMELPPELPFVRPFALLHSNATVYSVEWYVGAETIGDHLARIGRPIGWNTWKKMLTPLVGALERIHSDGTYHRGISAETVLLTEREELLLSGFCIPAARTADSEITATLYFGYSAPEQYSSNSWQGSWSDVYSLAAVCYLALTGIPPIEWRQRGEKHPLIPPRQLNPDIPQHVSDALIRALSVDLRTRYRTVGEFWIALLNEPGSGTVTYPISVLRREDSPETAPALFGIRSLVFALLLTLLVAVIALGISFKIVDTQFAALPADNPQEPASQPQETVSQPQEPQILIPNLVGHNIEEVLLDPLYRSLFRFTIERVFSEIHPAGEIVAQVPDAGSDAEEGEIIDIRVWVCKGSQQIAMPTVEGMTLEKAGSLLEGLEIVYRWEPVEAPEAENGTVVSSSVPAGETVYRSADTVILYVADNPDSPEEEEEEKSSSSEYVYRSQQGTMETRPYFYQRGSSSDEEDEEVE